MDDSGVRLLRKSSPACNREWEEGKTEKDMASRESGRFPQQRQPTQPGKEHLMDPIPQAINPIIALPPSFLDRRAVCLCFANEGATVAFTYLKNLEEKDADDTLRMLLHAKDEDAQNPIAVAADLGYDRNCKRVVEEIVSLSKNRYTCQQRSRAAPDQEP
ncbi:hypothetical protein Drorol1_Dr00007792 [Drosera rotundifolia]